MSGDRSPVVAGEARITADALVVIRAERLAELTGMHDPHAHLFVTDEGRRMAAMAERVDPVYVPYNLARFRFFAEKMAKAAEHVDQILILGAGYDTRSLWLPGLAGAGVRVFEVDFPATIAGKESVLGDAGIDTPDQVARIASDLGDDALGERLADTGFEASRPAAVFLEGVVFFLPPATTAAILDPRTLDLAPGSSVTFDYWPRKRIDGLNTAVEKATGRRLFGAFPFADDPHGLTIALEDLGYRDVAIVPLSTLAERLWLEEDPYSPQGDWRVVTAVVG